MAMSGGFAGGMAQGLRNGMALYDAYGRGQDRNDAREKRKKDEGQSELIEIAQADAASRNPNAGKVDLSGVAVNDGLDLNQSMGLQPVTLGQGATPGMPMLDRAQQPDGTAGLPSSGAGQPMPQSGSVGPGLMSAVNERHAIQPNSGAVGGLPQAADDRGDLEKSLAGYTAGIEEAYRLKRPDKAMELLTQREKIAGVHREQAYGQALSEFQASNDPNAFVPFVNNFLSTGMKINTVESGDTTADGMPIYIVKGADSRTGKPFQRAVSGGQFTSFIQSVADPQAGKAMFVDQVRRTVEDAKALRDHQFKVEQKQSEPQKLGKDDTLYVSDGQGGMRLAASGSDVDGSQGGSNRRQDKALVDRNKGLSSYVFKLHGVDSMEGIKDDQRQQIATTIALGENINKLNPGVTTLGDANTAQLSQNLSTGEADVYPVRLGDGIGYATEFQGEQILVPPSTVPMTIRQRFERQGERASSDSQPPAKASGAPSAKAEPAKAGAKSPAKDQAQNSPAGKELDAARGDRKNAEEKIRDVRKRAPGLKEQRSDPSTRAEFQKQLQAAEAVLKRAKAAEGRARTKWDKSNADNPANKAFFGN